MLAPLGRVHAEIQSRRAAYAVEVGILYQTLSFHLAGTIHEAVDRVAGRYDVRIVGEGVGIGNRVESSGVLRGARWAPVRTTAWFQVWGRESRSEVAYDYDRRTIDYHFRGETFFLRRLRAADDSLSLSDSTHVDDVISAVLNHADGRWRPRADGTLQTLVVRRQRREDEGPDDVERVYRAELAPLVLKATRDPGTGKPAALFDLSRFSSWAMEGRPARVVFGFTGRPELIQSSLILGTSVTIRLDA
ncbi:MAG: hypothetical protein HY727_12240 [Candidatus Rokubacteria bacterium]|nr:hypothetical protein [Candidatus Rokubacteria bacterium]